MYKAGLQPNGIVVSSQRPVSQFSNIKHTTPSSIDDDLQGESLFISQLSFLGVYQNDRLLFTYTLSPKRSNLKALGCPRLPIFAAF